ncbi:MAG: hypothetical protein PHQ26_05110 [Bacteroidales bacterium]|nr:hypothetical protein [Bacteroidales bacterium]MDD3167616.1 hypothetical protein [Bacteroidales bacterium]MDD4770837.1 hypothetical protein [Bacteroidales bacterium]HKL92910.1 hypothetical protein [Bacteroidales bacterium]
MHPTKQIRNQPQHKEWEEALDEAWAEVEETGLETASGKTIHLYERSRSHSQ